jgi:hypothetical protein
MTVLRTLIAACFWSLSVAAYAVDVSGFWEHTYKDKEFGEITNTAGEIKTMISLVQRGTQVCGEWAEINYRGKVLTANSIGIIKGDLLQLKTDELVWGDDPPTPSDPDATRYDQFKWHRGRLVQVSPNGKLPDQASLASGFSMALTKNRERDAAKSVAAEFLTKCFDGLPYEGWNVGEMPIKRAKKAKRPAVKSQVHGL